MIGVLFGQGDQSASGENGFLSPLSLLNSEKAVQELLQQAPIQQSDDHLIEFSEALRSKIWCSISFQLIGL